MIFIVTVILAYCLISCGSQPAPRYRTKSGRKPTRVEAQVLDELRDQEYHFSWPVKFPSITSYHGWRESTNSFHQGIDIVSDNDPRIYAVLTGRIILVDYDRDNGLYISQVNSPFRISYLHLNRVFVADGMEVRQGQPIAIMGNTGQSRGTHLHISIFYNNQPINPLIVLP